jgi:hypothetical protein
MRVRSERGIAGLVQVSEQSIMPDSIQMREVFIRVNKGVKKDAKRTFDNL